MYLTRNMRARIPMTYMGRALVVGDEFQATELDAAYLAKHKRAEEANSAPVATNVPDKEELSAEPLVEQEEVAAPVRRRGRPRKNT